MSYADNQSEPQKPTNPQEVIKGILLTKFHSILLIFHMIIDERSVYRSAENKEIRDRMETIILSRQDEICTVNLEIDLSKTYKY